LAEGLASAGFTTAQISGILGENWRRFLATATRAQ
jgi:microsomal dipeptidase-like Zn-dependent dipeptidase